MRTEITAFLIVLFFAGTAFCRFSEIFVEYKNGDTEIVKKAEFKETVFFRTKGRGVEINPKKLEKIDVFADTIEIYYGETWVRTDIYPVSKDSVAPVRHGFIKISTILTGIADFGKLSISISELKHINFRPAKEKNPPETVPAEDAAVPEKPVENLDSIVVKN